MKDIASIAVAVRQASRSRMCVSIFVVVQSMMHENCRGFAEMLTVCRAKDVNSCATKDIHVHECVLF